MAKNQRMELDPVLREATLFPDSDGYDLARRGWNLTVDQRPRAIVVARNPDDVMKAVEFAASADLPIAVQASGHGVSVPADDALLISTRRMAAVKVDPSARTARVEAGVLGRELVTAAAEYGLASLSGSSPTVGAIGYLLGGGLPVIGRRFGYAVDHVQALDLVTADGRPRRLTYGSAPELMSAVLGGKNNFGIVTSAEIDLMPVSRFYGGGLFFPGSDAERVVRTYLAWTHEQPEDMCSSVSLRRAPDLPFVPPAERGRFRVHVRITYLGPADTGERLVRPLRELGPETDTVTEMPYSRVVEIHGDPPKPSPACTRAALLNDLDDAGIDALLAMAGPDATLPPGGVELRHLGGALSRPSASSNAIGHRDAAFHLFASMLTINEDEETVRRRQTALFDRLGPWRTGGLVPGFMSYADVGPERVRHGYLPADYRRLAELKTQYDPRNLFRINHNIPPAA